MFVIKLDTLYYYILYILQWQKYISDIDTAGDTTYCWKHTTIVEINQLQGEKYARLSLKAWGPLQEGKISR